MKHELPQPAMKKPMLPPSIDSRSVKTESVVLLKRPGA